MMKIWKAYILAQEILTNQYSQPFTIKYIQSPNEGQYQFKYIDTLKVTIKDKIKSTFDGLSNSAIQIDNRFFYYPSDLLGTINNEALTALVEYCDSNFFDFEPMSFIEGTIKLKNEAPNHLLNSIEQTFQQIPSIHSTISKNKILKIRCDFENFSDIQGLRIRLRNIITAIDTTLFEVRFADLESALVRFGIKFRKKEYEQELYKKMKKLIGEDLYREGEREAFAVLKKIRNNKLTIAADNLNLIEGAVLNIHGSLKGEKDKIKRLRDTVDAIFNHKSSIVNPNLKKILIDASSAHTQAGDITRSTKYKEVLAFIQKALLAEQGRLNERQIEAITKSLLSEDMFIVQGPPGTGKSTAIAEIIWQHIRYNSTKKAAKDYKILVTSETNLAVDNALDKLRSKHHTLIKPIRLGSEKSLGKEGKRFSISNLERWLNDEDLEEDKGNIIEDWIAQIGDRSKNRMTTETKSLLSQWSQLLSSPNLKTRQLFFDTYRQNTNVVGATCSSIGKFTSDKPKPPSTRPFLTKFFKNYGSVFHSNEYRNFKDKVDFKPLYKQEIKFDLVIQDEASKASPPELALPCVYGKKAIIIGDHRQLPPMLNTSEFLEDLQFLLNRTKEDTDKKTIKELISIIKKNKEDFEKSHFETLFNKIPKNLKTTFNLQYRMHPAINETIKQFYEEEGGLECGLIVPKDLGVDSPDLENFASRYHGIDIPTLISKDTHVLWLDVQTPEFKKGTSRVNIGEVEAVGYLIDKISKSKSYKEFIAHWDDIDEQQIGIITFYGAQASLLNDLEQKFKHVPLRISPVDRFQGMERNIIIVSTVRSNCISSTLHQKPNFNKHPELGYPPQRSLGFAELPNRLNVALSRAKRLLIIVGNAAHFSQKQIYSNVLESIKQHKNGSYLKYNDLKKQTNETI